MNTNATHPRGRLVGSRHYPAPGAPRALAGLAIALGALGLLSCGDTEGAGGAIRAAATPQPEQTIPKGVPVQAYAADLAFRPDGRLRALVDDKVGVVDASGRVTATRSLRRSESATGAALSPDATRAVAYVQAGRAKVRVVTIASRTLRWTANSGTSQFEEDRAYWSSDGSRVLLQTDGPLRLRDARTGRLIRSFAPGTSYLGRQPLSPDGSTLAMSAKEGVALVDARTGRRRVIKLGAALDRPTWSADGRSIAGGGAGAVIVDVASGQVRRLEADSGAELAWSPDGRWIAAYAVGRSDQGEAGVSVIDAQTGQATVLAKTGAREEQGRLTWSHDSLRVAYISPPGIPCAPEAGGGIC